MKNIKIDLKTIEWAHRIGVLESQVLSLFAIHGIKATELPKQLDALYAQYAGELSQAEWKAYVTSIIQDEIKERCRVIEEHLSRGHLS